MSAVAERQSPYVGLTAYAEEDAEFFFGRAREIDLAIANLQASRLTLLYGESGVGKSSILLAGVMRELHREVERNLVRLRAAEPDEDEEPERPRLAAVLFRGPWVDPPVPVLMGTIHGAVEQAAGGHVAPWSPGDDVVETLRRWTQHVRTILVVLDQFEEYFLYHPADEARDTVAGALPAVVNDANLRVNFLLSIREDALAKLDRFKKHVPIFGNVLRINYLDERAARDAIERPLERWSELAGNGGGRYAAEPELVAEIIRQVRTGRVRAGAAAAGTAGADGANGSIETPVLQLVLTRLWDEERELGSRLLRLATFQERLRGAENIVRTQLDRTMAGLSEAERDAAARSFRYLVTPSGSKFAQSASDLAGFADVPHGELEAVLEKLAAGRILRPVPPPPGRQQEGTRYEIFHDVLGEPILEWRREFEGTREREAEARRQRALRRRLALIAAGLLVLALAFAGFAAWALHERGVAADRADVAESQALAARSIRVQSLDPRQSLVLAAQAAAKDSTPQAHEALRRALVGWPRPTVLVPEGSTVYAVDFSPDGRLVASAGEGGARVTSLSGRPVATLVPRKLVTSVRFSADGRYVVAATADGAIRVWRVAGWRELPSHARVRPYLLARAALSDDGRFLVAGGYPGWTNRVWRFADGRVGPELTTRGSVGGWIEPDGSARVVDARTAASAVRLALSSYPYSFTSSRDGSVSALARSDDEDEDDEVAVVRTRTGAMLTRLPASYHPVLSPGGRRIATEGSFGEIAISDLDGVPEAILAGGTGSNAGRSFSPDGRFVVSAAWEEDTARIWNAEDGVLLAEVPPQPPRPESEVTLDDPYPLPRGRPRPRSSTGSGQVVYPGRAFHLEPAARFSRHGRVVTWGRKDGGAQLWTPFGTRRLAQLRAGSQGSDVELLLPTAVSPDGRFVATARPSGDIELRGTRDGRRLALLRGGPDYVSSIAFSRRGDLIAAASFDRTVRIWHATTGQLANTLRGHTGRVGAVAFSPDGELLASASEDGTARVWQLPDGEPVRVLREPRGFVTSVAFSGDGDTLVTGGGEGTARVWSTRSWRERAVLQPPRSRALVLQVHVSRDGRVVATLDLGETARIWHTDGGQPIRTLRNVASVALSPGGEHVLVADGEATARILRAVDGAEVGLLRGHTDTVNDARFSPRADLIVTAGEDGWVRVWQAATNGTITEVTPSREPVLEAMLAADGRLVIVSEDAVRLFSCEPCLEPARLRALAKERLAAG